MTNNLSHILNSKSTYEREVEIYKSQEPYEWYESLIYEIPEKGLLIFKMSLIDYERAFNRYIKPLFKNLVGRRDDDAELWAMHYIFYRNKESKDLLKVDKKNLKKYPPFHAAYKESLRFFDWED